MHELNYGYLFIKSILVKMYMVHKCDDKRNLLQEIVTKVEMFYVLSVVWSYVKLSDILPH